MKNIAKYISILALLLAGVSSYAQVDITMYHMKDFPLNNQLNPAFQPKNGSIYLSFPIIPILGTTYHNTSIRGDGLNAGNFLSDKPSFSAIATDNSKFASVQTNIFSWSPISFGFMVKDMYLSLDLQPKIHVEGRIPRDLMLLAWYGNGHDKTIGRNLSLEGLGVEAYGYVELALGFSKELWKDELFVGGKLKYLQGLGYVQANLGKKSYIHTDKDNYNITVGINPEVYIGGLPINVSTNNLDSVGAAISDGLNNFSFSASNVGFAVDLGGSWNVPQVEGLNVSASLLDLGFIRWHGATAKRVSNEPLPTFEGIDLSNGDFLDKLLDTTLIATKVNVKSENFTKWLSPTLYMGANYHLFKYLNAGALLGFKFNKYETLPFFALSANTQNLRVNSSVSFSYYDGKPNVGLGLLFGRRGAQFHLLSDNILAAANYKKAQLVHFRMGVNFLLGKSRAKRTGAGNQDALAPSVKASEPLIDVVPESSPIEEVKSDAAPTAEATRQSVDLSKEDLLKRAMAEEKAEEREELLKRAIAEEKAEEQEAAQRQNAVAVKP